MIKINQVIFSSGLQNESHETYVERTIKNYKIIDQMRFEN